MSEPIKVGDLVQVVRACCPESEKYLGKTFVAQETIWGAECSHCDRNHGGPYFSNGKGPFSAWRLKRIPPLEELDDVKREEEIHA